MSTDQGFRLRNGTNRLSDAEAEGGRQETPEPELQPDREALLNDLPTMTAAVSMGILSPKKRKYIPVVQSLKAIVMSSCMCSPMPLRGRTWVVHAQFFPFLY